MEKVYDVQSIAEGKRDEEKAPVFRFLLFLVVVFLSFAVIKNSIGFYFVPVLQNTSSYAILFVLGVITSLHCIVMCGGINLSQSLPHSSEDKSSKLFSTIKKSLLYNIGRIVSYTVVGGIAGALGSVIELSGNFLMLFQICIGVIIILSGLKMLNIFTWFAQKFVMPVFLKKIVFKGYRSEYPFVVGLMNVFMQCGPLQAIQLFAISTKSIYLGAASMLVFSLGTLPITFSFGSLISFFTRRFGRLLMKANAVLVFFLGLGLILGALGLPNDFMVDFTSSNTVTVAGECDVGQKVTTELKPGKSSPIIIQEGIPLKWTINVESGYLSELNNEIFIPEYNLRQKLHQGENLIEFTPTKSEIITYSTWFGLVGSRIKVVKDVNKVRYKDVEEIGGVRTVMPTGLGCCE